MRSGCVAAAGARRQQNLERRPLPDPALDRDLAAVIADDAVADAEAEAGAFADFAGGEERIEDPAQVLVGDAVAGVGDEELDRVGLGDVPRADPDLRVVRARIACSAFSSRLSSACCSWPPSPRTGGSPGSKSVSSSIAFRRNS